MCLVSPSPVPIDRPPIDEQEHTPSDFSRILSQRSHIVGSLRRRVEIRRFIFRVLDFTEYRQLALRVPVVTRAFGFALGNQRLVGSENTEIELGDCRCCRPIDLSLVFLSFAIMHEQNLGTNPGGLSLVLHTLPEISNSPLVFGVSVLLFIYYRQILGVKPSTEPIDQLRDQWILIAVVQWILLEVVMELFNNILEVEEIRL